MSTEFDELKAEVIAEIKANPHKYPSVCQMMIGKIERLESELVKLRTDIITATTRTERFKAALEEIIEDADLDFVGERCMAQKAQKALADDAKEGI